MTAAQRKMMAAQGLKDKDFKPMPKETTVEISRFEFELLEMTYSDTTYRIHEDDGTITTIKGEF